VQRAQIRETLDTFFDDGELRTLCFDLGIDYDNLPGDGKADKARELVSYCERRGEVVTLFQAIYRRRPNAFWKDELARIQREACEQTIELPAPWQSGGNTGPLLQFSLNQFAQMLRETNERIASVEHRMLILWIFVGLLGLLDVIVAAAMVLSGR